MSYTIDRETLGSHIDGVRRLARSLVLDEAEADDVVQDTMLVALQSESERRAGPKAWLSGVTRNVVRRLARSEGRRRRHERAGARPEAVEATDEVVIRAAEQSRLLDQVVGLDEPYRTAILLRFVEDLSPREIARRQGIPLETARTQVKRGLRKLRDRLDREHGGRRDDWRAALALIAQPAGSASASAFPLGPASLAPGLAVVVGLLLFLLFASRGVDEDRGPPVSVEEARAPARDGAGVAPEKRPVAPAAERAGPVAPVAQPEAAPRPLPAARTADPQRARGTLAYSDNGFPVLDPAHAGRTRLNDERLIVSLLDCLTVLDPRTGKAGPGAAERWDVSADKRTWTFHLRGSALWSDGSPVAAKDFVRAWLRVMDPYTRSPWTDLYRPIQGCATLAGQSDRAETISSLYRGLHELARAFPEGIPGERLVELLADTGAGPFLRTVRSRSVARLLEWKWGDLLPPEIAKKAIEALRKEKREAKDLWAAEFERLGKAGSGIHAQDDHTLVVRTAGDVSYLPELVARSAFAPLHADVESKRERFFDPGNFVSSGPFLLKGRGARPPDNQPGKRVLSVVHLVRNPAYDGPSPAGLDAIKCFTDQGAGGPGYKVDLRQFEAGKLQWANMTWPDGVPPRPTSVRAEIEGLGGYTVRDAPLVLYLRFRCDSREFREKSSRQALAMSIDREEIAGRLWPKARPAYRIVPPGIAGRVEGVAGPGMDLAAAKAAAKKAGINQETWIELSHGEGVGEDVVAGQLVHGWKKHLGLDPGVRIESTRDVRLVTRSGSFQAMLTVVRGAVNDPCAYVGPLHSGDPDSGHGWRDAATDALLDAARDPDLALASPEKWLETVGQPQLAAPLAAARTSSAGRARFRLEALAAAEQRLLDEFVVVPILFLREAALVNGVTGLGKDAAYANPGFVGSLRTARR